LLLNLSFDLACTVDFGLDGESGDDSGFQFAADPYGRSDRSPQLPSIDPIKVFQMATINVAQHYGLWGLGAIAPGWLADIVLLDDLSQVRVRHVVTSGKIRVQDGALLHPIPEPAPPLMENSVHLPHSLGVERFILQANSQPSLRVNAINLANLIDTRLEPLDLPYEHRQVVFPLPDGVCLAAVVGRHGQNHPPSLTFTHCLPAPDWGGRQHRQP